MGKMGVIGAAFLFILGVALALPDEANIGVMILEAFQSGLCSGDNASNAACGWIQKLREIGIIPKE